MAKPNVGIRKQRAMNTEAPMQDESAPKKGRGSFRVPLLLWLYAGDGPDFAPCALA